MNLDEAGTFVVGDFLEFQFFAGRSIDHPLFRGDRAGADGIHEELRALFVLGDVVSDRELVRVGREKLVEREFVRRQQKNDCGDHCMNLPISAAVLGAPPDSSFAPSLVTSTSSSMRTPIPLYLSSDLAMDACSSFVRPRYVGFLRTSSRRT